MAVRVTRVSAFRRNERHLHALRRPGHVDQLLLRDGAKTSCQAGSSGPACPQLSFNAKNQIQGFSYGARGGLISDGVFTYSYDGEGRLSSIGSPASTSFTYNALGQQAVENANGTKEDYLFDPAGHFVARYVEGFGWDNVGSFYLGDRLLGSYYTSHTYFRHVNVLGGENGVTDWRGSENGVELFDPWGVQVPSLTAGTPVIWDFAGFEHGHTNVALWPGTFREHNPSLGRWLTPDPLAGDLTNPQSLNRYAYALNNPTTLIDPFGLQSCTTMGACNVGTTLTWNTIPVTPPTVTAPPLEPPASPAPGIDETGPSDNGAGAALWGLVGGDFGGGPIRPYSDDTDRPRPGSYGGRGTADVPVGTDIWHCTGCGKIWNNTAGVVNGLAFGTVGLPAAAFGAATVGPPALASVVGYWNATFGGSTAAIVLGPSPVYVTTAREIGAYALNTRWWSALSALGEEWTANQVFLNTAINRGYSIFLAAQPTAARVGSYFWSELQYLASRGIDPASLPVLAVPH